MRAPVRSSLPHPASRPGPVADDRRPRVRAVGGERDVPAPGRDRPRLPAPGAPARPADPRARRRLLRAGRPQGPGRHGAASPAGPAGRRRGRPARAARRRRWPIRSGGPGSAVQLVALETHARALAGDRAARTSSTSRAASMRRPSDATRPSSGPRPRAWTGSSRARARCPSGSRPGTTGMVVPGERLSAVIDWLVGRHSGPVPRQLFGLPEGESLRRVARHRPAVERLQLVRRWAPFAGRREHRPAGPSPGARRPRRPRDLSGPPPRARLARGDPRRGASSGSRRASS